MAAKKAGARKADGGTGASELRRAHAAAQQSEDWKPFFRAMAATIAQATNGAALDAIFRSAACREGVFDEMEYDPAIADALVKRAESFTHGADAAIALGWLVRASGFHPHGIMDRERPSAKRAFLGAMSRHRSTFRAALASKDAARRAGNAYALAACEEANGDDAKALAAACAIEKDREARASMLFGLGCLLRRSDAGASPAGRTLSEQASASSTDASALLRLSTIAAKILLGEALDTASVDFLATMVAKPTPLPLAWGWYFEKPKNAGSDRVVIVLTALLRAAETKSLVDALVEHGPADLGEAERQGKALVHLVLAARGKSLPPEGIAHEDVDAELETTLQWLASREEGEQATALAALGIPGRSPEDVGPFLARKAPEWKPIALQVDGRTRHWHFSKIAGAVALGRVSVEAASKAILDGLTPNALGGLIFETSPCIGRLEQLAQEYGKGAPERLCELFLALGRTLEERGSSKIDTLMKAARKDEYAYRVPLLLTLWLEKKPKRFESWLEPLLVNAIDEAACAAPLHELLALVPEDMLERALSESSGDFRFHDLLITKKTLDQMFGIVAEYGEKYASLAEAALRRALPTARAALKDYRASDPERAKAAKPILERVLRK